VVFAASIIRAMIKEVYTSETSVSFYEITRRCIPEDNHLHKILFMLITRHRTRLMFTADPKVLSDNQLFLLTLRPPTAVTLDNENRTLVLLCLQFAPYSCPRVFCCDRVRKLQETHGLRSVFSVDKLAV
jgi:hypothetical protein